MAVKKKISSSSANPFQGRGGTASSWRSRSSRSGGCGSSSCHRPSSPAPAPLAEQQQRHQRLSQGWCVFVASSLVTVSKLIFLLVALSATAMMVDAAGRGENKSVTRNITQTSKRESPYGFARPGGSQSFGGQNTTAAKGQERNVKQGGVYAVTSKPKPPLFMKIRTSQKTDKGPYGTVPAGAAFQGTTKGGSRTSTYGVLSGYSTIPAERQKPPTSVNLVGSSEIEGQIGDVSSGATGMGASTPPSGESADKAPSSGASAGQIMRKQGGSAFVRETKRDIRVLHVMLSPWMLYEGDSTSPGEFTEEHEDPQVIRHVVYCAIPQANEFSDACIDQLRTYWKKLPNLDPRFHLLVPATKLPDLRLMLKKHFLNRKSVLGVPKNHKEGSIFTAIFVACMKPSEASWQ